MKPAEYRGMGDEQLRLSLKEVTKNLFHLRFQSATERLEFLARRGRTLASSQRSS